MEEGKIQDLITRLSDPEIKRVVENALLIWATSRSWKENISNLLGQLSNLLGDDTAEALWAYLHSGPDEELRIASPEIYKYVNGLNITYSDQLQLVKNYYREPYAIYAIQTLKNNEGNYRFVKFIRNDGECFTITTTIGDIEYMVKRLLRLMELIAKENEETVDTSFLSPFING